MLSFLEFDRVIEKSWGKVRVRHLSLILIGELGAFRKPARWGQGVLLALLFRTFVQDRRPVGKNVAKSPWSDYTSRTLQRLKWNGEAPSWRIQVPPLPDLSLNKKASS